MATEVAQVSYESAFAEASLVNMHKHSRGAFPTYPLDNGPNAQSSTDWSCLSKQIAYLDSLPIFAQPVAGGTCANGPKAPQDIAPVSVGKVTVLGGGYTKITPTAGQIPTATGLSLTAAPAVVTSNKPAATQPKPASTPSASGFASSPQFAAAYKELETPLATSKSSSARPASSSTSSSSSTSVSATTTSSKKSPSSTASPSSTTAKSADTAGNSTSLGSSTGVTSKAAASSSPSNDLAKSISASSLLYAPVTANSTSAEPTAADRPDGSRSSSSIGGSASVGEHTILRDFALSGHGLQSRTVCIATLLAIALAAAIVA